MQRKNYFDYVEEKLAILSIRVKNRGKLNILDVHMHSENFYRDFINLLYGWSLENANNRLQNIEAIDLIDDNVKLIVQVSATATKTKINNSLSKKSIEEYAKRGYTFKFVSIAENADQLRQQKYNNLYNIGFNPKKDIYDISSLEKDILNLKLQKLEEVYQFIKAELGNMPDCVRFNSDLTTIINILAEVKLDENEPLGNINMFEIDKKIEFNKLDIAASIIDDYKIFYNQVEKKYRDIDALLKNKYDNSDLLFVGLIDEVKEIVINSSNYFDISKETLEACASLLVVDAFMRCKIFKNPEGYAYVIT